MYKIPKKNYTIEFKQEAVRQVEAEGKSPAQVARDLGIAEQTLANWRTGARQPRRASSGQATANPCPRNRGSCRGSRRKMPA